MAYALLAPAVDAELDKRLNNFAAQMAADDDAWRCACGRAAAVAGAAVSLRLAVSEVDVEAWGVHALHRPTERSLVWQHRPWVEVLELLTSSHAPAHVHVSHAPSHVCATALSHAARVAARHAVSRGAVRRKKLKASGVGLNPTGVTWSSSHACPGERV